MATPRAREADDTDEVIQLANAATEKLFGYGRGELVRRRADMPISDGHRNMPGGHRNGRLQREVGFFPKPHAGPMKRGARPDRPTQGWR